MMGGKQTSSPLPSVRTIARRVRETLGRLRHQALARGRRALPDRVKYGTIVSIEELRALWPPLHWVFPEPFVYRPTRGDQPVVSLNRRFAGRSVTLPPVPLHLLVDGIVFPASGAMADAGGNLVLESAKDRLLLARTDAYHRLRLPPGRIQGDRLCSTVMNGSQSGSWGHWIIDALPRLYALGQLEAEVSLLVTERVRGVFREVLEWALPPNVRLRQVDGRPLRVSSLVLSPFTTIGGCGLMRPEVAQYLRTRFLAVAGRFAPPGGRRRRLYVSRAGATNRRVSNEGELLAALARYGIEPCRPETLSPAEQMALFRDAELVVGAHGSGLTGVLVASDAAVIEIHANGLTSARDLPLFNWGLAVTAGCRYRVVLHGCARGVEEFAVDVPQVTGAVEAALEQAA